MNTEPEIYFEEIVEKHQEKILRLCKGYLNNDESAYDLFQEILIKIWRNLKSFRGESSISTWIFRISVNTALTYAEKRTKYYKRFRSIIESDFKIHSSNINYEQQESIKLLRKAISSLKEIDRIIISLVLEEISYKEIGEIVGISENYVGVKVNRIKDELSKILDEQ